MTSYNPDETTTQQTPAINTETGEIIRPIPPVQAQEPWQEWVDMGREFLAKVPDYIGQFFADYKQPLITIGLILAGLITVRFTLAILDAINDIPLLAPTLELVGLGYTAWFVYRYLWRASSREELSAEIEALKNQIVGDN